jgi:hypothetical protein
VLREFWDIDSELREGVVSYAREQSLVRVACRGNVVLFGDSLRKFRRQFAEKVLCADKSVEAGEATLASSNDGACKLWRPCRPVRNLAVVLAGLDCLALEKGRFEDRGHLR